MHLLLLPCTDSSGKRKNREIQTEVIAALLHKADDGGCLSPVGGVVLP